MRVSVEREEKFKLESPALENPKVETLNWTVSLQAASPI